MDSTGLRSAARRLQRVTVTAVTAAVKRVEVLVFSIACFHVFLRRSIYGMYAHIISNTTN